MFSFIFILCGWVFCLCVCVYAGSAHGDQKGVTDPQGLELQMAVGCPVDVGKGTEALWKNSALICCICNPHPIYDQPSPQGSGLSYSLTLHSLSEAQKAPSLPLAEFEIFSLETQGVVKTEAFELEKRPTLSIPGYLGLLPSCWGVF